MDVGVVTLFLLLFTNDRQKTKDYKGHMSTQWIYNKTVNICGILSSPEEASEFCQNRPGET